MNADLHAFVRDALARGISREDLRKALLEARWSADEVESELAAWHDAGLGVPVPRRSVAISPREAFLHLLMFVALYLVAFHLGSILFAWIAGHWPDAAMGRDDSSLERSRDAVRFSVATLLVAFPVYLFVARTTSRAVARDPEKRNSGVRRWLTYLTLFNAACVLIGDFITVLLGMLKGELTTPFLAKAAVVALIAGWLFSHYMGGLKREEEATVASPATAWLARAAALAVLAVTVLGMWVAGSPARVRSETLDHERLGDLESLSQAVDHYRYARGGVPVSLEQMARSEPGVVGRLTDPVTFVPYAFTPIDSTSFELCATFDRPDSLAPGSNERSEFWRHPAGRACFRFHYRQRP